MLVSGTSPTDAAAAIAGVAIALYFAPTIVAVARRRGAGGSTLIVNLCLGWTGIGWLLAWVLAFRDRRLHLYLVGSQRTPPAPVVLAPDGRWWWDGAVWRDGWRVAPLSALWSPDARCWLAGAQWVGEPAERFRPPATAVASGAELADEPEWWRRITGGRDAA